MHAYLAMFVIFVFFKTFFFFFVKKHGMHEKLFD